MEAVIWHAQLVKHPAEPVRGFTGHKASNLCATFDDMGKKGEDRCGDGYKEGFRFSTLGVGEGDCSPFQIDTGGGNTTLP